MSGLRKKRIVFGVFILFSCFLLQAETTQQNTAISFPENANYIIGFCSFSGQDLSPENLHLQRSIPMLLKENLESLRTHTFSAEQVAAHQHMLLLDKIRELNKRLQAEYEKKDEIIFKNESKADIETAQKTADKKIEEIIEKIKELKAFDPTEITVPEELPVQIKTGAGAGMLLDPPSFSALQYVRANAIDFLLYGHIEEIHGYIFITISVFDRLLEKEVYAYHVTLSQEEVYPALDPIKTELSKLILGREWASLLVIPDPPVGFVYVNDEFEGIGNTTVNFLKPGKTEVRVVHQDYFEEKRDVELIPFEKTECHVSLTKIELEFIQITSVPAEANVYVNSVWKGITPLEISRSIHLQRILIKKGDFDEISFHIGEGGDNTITVELRKSIMSGEKRQEVTRDNFYEALGYFFLSIPLPVFLKGLADDYANMRDYILQFESEDYNQASILQSGFLLAHYGTLIVSGGLFVNLIIKLIEYINAADRPIG